MKNTSTNKGDELLNANVPMVVGVYYTSSKFRGTGKNNHYITVVKGSTNDVWAIDSWGSDPDGSVARIDRIVAMSFGIPMAVSLNVNGPKGVTVIPGSNPVFGYFEEAGAPMKLAISV